MKMNSIECRLRESSRPMSSVFSRRGFSTTTATRISSFRRSQTDTASLPLKRLPRPGVAELVVASTESMADRVVRSNSQHSRVPTGALYTPVAVNRSRAGWSGASAEDVFSFNAGNGITLSGGNLVKNSQVIATFDTSTTPGQLVITFTDANGETPTSADVDIYRDGVIVLTTANDGSETDPIDLRGGGSYTYQVCEAGTSTCSGEVTVTF